MKKKDSYMLGLKLHPDLVVLFLIWMERNLVKAEANFSVMMRKGL
jgi:hypothetical protein